MKMQDTFFCWDDGYLLDKADRDKPCPVCGGTKIWSLLDQMFSIYDWGFPIRRYELSDKRKFLSCRNAVVCRKCGDIQSRQNKTCQACGHDKFRKFKDVYGEIKRR